METGVIPMKIPILLLFLSSHCFAQDDHFDYTGTWLGKDLEGLDQKSADNTVMFRLWEGLLGEVKIIQSPNPTNHPLAPEQVTFVTEGHFAGLLEKMLRIKVFVAQNKDIDFPPIPVPNAPRADQVQKVSEIVTELDLHNNGQGLSKIIELAKTLPMKRKIQITQELVEIFKS
jgi:hypothetical protein